MILSFIKTKIGIASLCALAVIGSAVTLKIRENQPDTSLKAQVGLIADASVKQGIKEGQPTDLDSIIQMPTSTDTVLGISDTASSAPETLTATDRFSRDFFQKYIDLKKSGTTIDETTGMGLVNNLLGNDYGSPTEEKVYTEQDIHIAPTATLEVIKNYANAVGEILQTPTPTGYEQELWLLARVNDTGNTADLSKLSMNVDRYTSMRNALLSLSVPNPLKTTHLAIINSLSATLEGVRGMTYIQSDPVGATKMIARYQDGFNSLPIALQALKTYLLKLNISFSSDESGYILTQ